MTVEYSQRGDSPGDERPTMTACPFCGDSIDGGSAFRHHMPCDAAPVDDNNNEP